MTPIRRIIPLLTLLCSVPVSYAAAADSMALAAADTSDGYSGQVLRKVARFWAPPLDTQNRMVTVRLSIDSDGKLVQCTAVKASDLPAVNKAACEAAHEAESFGVPPYGMRLDVYVTFWTGYPSKSIIPVPPAENSAAPTQAAKAPAGPAGPSAAASAPKGANAADKVKAADKDPKANKSTTNDKPDKADKADKASKDDKRARLDPDAATTPIKKAAPAASPAATPVKTPATPPKATSAPAKAAPASTPAAPAKVAPATTSKGVPVLVTPKPKTTETSPPPPRSKDVPPPPKAETSATPKAAGTRTQFAPYRDPTLKAAPEKSAPPSATLQRYTEDITQRAQARITPPVKVPAGKHKVSVQLSVSGTGEVLGVEMARSSGHPPLDEAVMRTLMQTEKFVAPPDKQAHELKLTFTVHKP